MKIDETILDQKGSKPPTFTSIAGSSPCNNCGGTSFRELRHIDSSTEPVPTSDGKFFGQFSATRRLCLQCGCFEVQSSAPERTEQFYRTEYDLSPRFQNNWIITPKGRVEKYTVLTSNLLPILLRECKGAPKNQLKLLEVACGSGQFLASLGTSLTEWQLTGIDPQANLNNHEKIHFIREFFDPKIFRGAQFNALIAHGLLNRVPTLKTLRQLNQVLQRGGILSAEVVCLEDSDYAPFVWDHSYTFTAPTFISYLRIAGFEVIEEHHCMSTRQFICRKRNDGEMNQEFNPKILSEGLALYSEHLNTWHRRQESFELAMENHGYRYGLFGAGLYSAVLLSLVQGRPSQAPIHEQIHFIVDERAEGTAFLGIPLKAVKHLTPGDCVLLCARKGYQKHILDLLRQSKVKHVNLDEERCLNFF